MTKNRIVVETAVHVAGSPYYVATAEEWLNGTWVAQAEGDGPDALAAALDLARTLHLSVIGLQGRADS